MIVCRSCGVPNAEGPAACVKCGGELVSAGLQDLKDEKVLREFEESRRIRRRRLAHAAAGAVTFFVINVVLGVPGSLFFSSILVNGAASIVFGAPLGYVISRLGGGLYRGAFAAAAAYMLVRLAIGVPALARGADFADVAAMSVLWGLLGALPGAFLGLHVDVDD